MNEQKVPVVHSPIMLCLSSIVLNVRVYLTNKTHTSIMNKDRFIDSQFTSVSSHSLYCVNVSKPNNQPFQNGGHKLLY